VRVPAVVGRVDLPRVGDEIVLQWTSEEGLVHANAVLVAVEGRAAPVWRVRLTGDADLRQRRRHPRTPLATFVSVAPATDPERVRLGTLIDLSVGGARFRSRAGDDVAGQRVIVRMVLSGNRAVNLPGDVLRVGPDGPEHAELVVRFDEGHELADAVRKAVLAEQRRRRRKDWR
jgi:hypothetical protein